MDEQEEEAAAPATAPDSFRVRSSRVVLDTSASPARLRQRQQQQQQQQQPVVATRDAARQQQQQAAGGWDPQLLAACAANQAYITSEEALQTSPLYVDHIRCVAAACEWRGRGCVMQTSAARQCTDMLQRMRCCTLPCTTHTQPPALCGASS
jgi:hypothetical protein